MKKKKITVYKHPKADPEIRFDLGCGKHKKEGFIGVDLAAVDGVDFVCDLKKTPWVLHEIAVTSSHHIAYDRELHGPRDEKWWYGVPGRKPIADGTVDEVHCSHFLEHLTGEERIPFMAELWRILKPGAKAVIIVPDYRSVRAIQDPTHKFPPIGPQSFMYWNAEWRNSQGNDIHYIENGHPIDFDFSWAESYDQAWGNRSADARVFGANHYNNVVQDIIVTMVKKQEAAAG